MGKGVDFGEIEVLVGRQIALSRLMLITGSRLERRLQPILAALQDR